MSLVHIPFHFNIGLFCHLRPDLPSGLFPSSWPTKILFAFFHVSRAYNYPRILLSFIWRPYYRLVKTRPTNYEPSHCVIFSSLLLLAYNCKLILLYTVDNFIFSWHYRQHGPVTRVSLVSCALWLEYIRIILCTWRWLIVNWNILCINSSIYFIIKRGVWRNIIHVIIYCYCPRLFLRPAYLR
jgi:hypothetical protein